MVTLSPVLAISRAKGRRRTPPAAPVTVPWAFETATAPAGPDTSTETVATSWIPGPLPRSAEIDTLGNRFGVMMPPQLDSGRIEVATGLQPLSNEQPPRQWDNRGRPPYGHPGWRDNDRDGVPNRYDRRPNDPYRR